METRLFMFKMEIIQGYWRTKIIVTFSIFRELLAIEAIPSLNIHIVARINTESAWQTDIEYFMFSRSLVPSC